MILHKTKHIGIALLILGALFILSSCHDDDLFDGTEQQEEMFKDVYSVNLMVTLDPMSVSSNTAKEPAEITKWENYIDLERFRILFFDDNDKFLFESKNRWVKQIDLNDNFSSWYVSIPFGPFGNDSYGEGKEYDWNAIRTHLTTKKFKVAILANRPAQLRYPGFVDSNLSLPSGVFDNDGPYWGPDDTGKRDIFDLHHFQYDIIYKDKGNPKMKDGQYDEMYDFVMDYTDKNQPKMGSSINWVSFDNGDKDSEVLTSSVNMRNIKMPSAEHPIPMYGIQEFEPIPAQYWKEGTPFDLSNLPTDVFPTVQYNYKSISLLRSCVRLDLRIPKSAVSNAPQFVTLWYSNIYSRCEPMDTWTPTDQIWKTDHNNGCEWESILNYGPISSDKAPGNGSTKDDYQKQISWIYGIWQEKKWPFKRVDGKTVTPVAATASTPYPHIFNPCIQRNKVIRCHNGDVTKYYNDGYYHWIVYTGERNCNDPNTLPDMVKNPYIACFVIGWKNKTSGDYYCIPLLDYKNNTDTDVTKNISGVSPAVSVFGPHNYDPSSTGSWPKAMDTYIGNLRSKRGANLPYPLLRNHVYRFTLTGKTRAGEDGDELQGISVTSEVLQTPDINYSKEIRAIKPAVIKEKLQEAQIKRW